MVVKFLEGMGRKTSAAMASATVLLSPRKEDSKRGKFGNCLGNFSADGVNYYMIALNHKKGEEKKFRFHASTPDEVTARTAIDEKRGNGRKVTEVKQVKVAIKKTSKAPVKKVVKKVAKKVKKVAKVAKVAKVEAVVTPTVETPAPAVVETAVTPAPETPAV
jgi:glycyl-tRNA synthetase (class II)